MAGGQGHGRMVVLVPRRQAPGRARLTSPWAKTARPATSAGAAAVMRIAEAVLFIDKMPYRRKRRTRAATVRPHFRAGRREAVAVYAQRAVFSHNSIS